MKFIALTSVNVATKGNILLNADTIESMVSDEYAGTLCTRIFTIGDSDDSYLVKESVSEILELIERQVM